MIDRFKFRVWDKRLNRYLGKDDPTPMLMSNGNLAYLDDEGMKFYEVEQCTGLQDRYKKQLKPIQVNYANSGIIRMKDMLLMEYY